MLSDELSKLTHKLSILDEEIADLEAVLSDRKKERERILTDDMVTLLHSNGIATASLLDGRVIDINKIFGLSKVNKSAMALWLAESGYDSIVKTSYLFPKGTDLSAIEEMLATSGISYIKKQGYAPNSLKKVLKDHIEAGGEVPSSVGELNIFERARIKGDER